MFDHEYWMREALKRAEIAKNKHEVPVGAILILDNQVVAEGANAPIGLSDPSAHAEMLAIRQYAQQINNYRLLNTTLYVTLEPCLMCAGAMVHARIKTLVYGAPDKKTGVIESVMQVLNQPFLNHHISYKGGILAKECGAMLQDFFKERRVNL